MAAGTPDELKRRVGADTVELITADDPAAAAHLEAAGSRVSRGGEQLVVFISCAAAGCREALQVCVM